MIYWTVTEAGCTSVLTDPAEPVIQVPYGADFCVLSRRADGVPVVQALHLANPGFSRIPQATCIKLAKQHMELYKIVNYIRRSGDKQSSADLIGLCGYRIPMGQGVFGRYNL